MNSMVFAGIEFEHPLMNGGGSCKTMEDLEKIVRSTASCVLVNMLVHVRGGNSGETYWSNGRYSLNSKGLPSPGEQYYIDNLPEMVIQAHAAGKRIGVNISGFGLDEYVRLAKIAAAAGVDFIELNFGCPNLWEGMAQKVILSFNPEGIRLVLKMLREAGITIPIVIKLSPFSNPDNISEMCELLTKCDTSDEFVKVAGLTICNTFPNVYALHPMTRKPRILSPDVPTGLGGLGGGAMFPIALGQLHQFKLQQKDGHLPEHFQFIGAGGIRSTQEIEDFLDVGACLVQVATEYFDSDENPMTFTNILDR